MVPLRVFYPAVVSRSRLRADRLVVHSQWLSCVASCRLRNDSQSAPCVFTAAFFLLLFQFQRPRAPLASAILDTALSPVAETWAIAAREPWARGLRRLHSIYTTSPLVCIGVLGIVRSATLLASVRVQTIAHGTLPAIFRCRRSMTPRFARERLRQPRPLGAVDRMRGGFSDS